MRDREAYEAILETTHPKDAKDIGQGVQHFDEELWNEVLCSVAFECVLQKYGRNEELRDKLISTGDKLLVEASPSDVNWGVGLKSNDPSVRMPDQWRGANVLGWALMEARECLLSGPVYLPNGTFDLAACRAYMRNTAGLSVNNTLADDDVIEDLCSEAIDLSHKIIKNLLRVPTDSKFLKLQDKIIRQRCDNSYESISALLVRIGFSLEESRWTYVKYLDSEDTHDLLVDVRRRLSEVIWLRGR